MSTVHLHIRPADCDNFGHVNNAVYPSFLEQALAESLEPYGLLTDWGAEGNHMWRLKNLSIEYRQAAALGDRLRTSLWLADGEAAEPVLGCEIKRLADEAEKSEETIVRSLSTWQRVQRQGTQVADPDGDWLAALPRTGGRVPRPFRRPRVPPGTKAYLWQHRVMRAEVNPAGVAHIQAIYHWLEESLFDASAQGGWPTERRLVAGFVTLQTRHDTEFFTLPQAGGVIQTSSRLVEVRRLGGTWLIEGRRLSDGELSFRDYSTGIFLNLEGRPATPPQEMMDHVRYGSG